MKQTRDKTLAGQSHRVLVPVEAEASPWSSLRGRTSPKKKREISHKAIADIWAQARKSKK